MAFRHVVCIYLSVLIVVYIPCLVYLVTCQTHSGREDFGLTLGKNDFCDPQGKYKEVPEFNRALKKHIWMTIMLKGRL